MVLKKTLENGKLVCVCVCVCVFGTTVQLMVVSVCMCCNAEYFLPVLTDQMY